MAVLFAGTGKKGAQVSDLTVGEGASCEWQAAAMDKETTIAFYFEVTNQHVSNLPPGDSLNAGLNILQTQEIRMDECVLNSLVISTWVAVFQPFLVLLVQFFFSCNRV